MRKYKIKLNCKNILKWVASIPVLPAIIVLKIIDFVAGQTAEIIDNGIGSTGSPFKITKIDEEEKNNK